jgi:alcohol dehydrogenase
MNSFSWHETIPHGKSTGITLPYYIVYYAKNPVVAEKLAKVAPFLSVSITSQIGVAFAKAMLKWYQSMGYPTHLGELKEWKSNYLEKALVDAGQNEMKLKAMPNPVPLEKVDIFLKPIIEAAISGDLSKIK